MNPQVRTGTCASHLNDFDNAAAGRDVDPGTGAGGNHLVGRGTLARSYNDLLAAGAATIPRASC